MSLEQIKQWVTFTYFKPFESVYDAAILLACFGVVATSINVKYYCLRLNRCKRHEKRGIINELNFWTSMMRSATVTVISSILLKTFLTYVGLFDI